MIVIDELVPLTSLSAAGANTRRLRGSGSLSTCTEPDGDLSGRRTGRVVLCPLSAFFSFPLLLSLLYV